MSVHSAAENTFFLAALPLTGARMVVPSGDSLLMVPKAPELGQPRPRPLEFNSPIPALDDCNVGYACTARSLGVNLTCNRGGLLEACEGVRRACDEKTWKTGVLGRPFPLPGGTCLDGAFKTVHPDYEPVATDAEYYLAETLGIRKAQELNGELRERTAKCTECQSELAAAAAADGKEAAPPPAAAAAAAAAAEVESKKRSHLSKAERVVKSKRDAAGKARALPPRNAKFHSCLKDGTGGDPLFGKRDFVTPKRLENSIFTANGTRNNLPQLLRLARESDLHRLQLRSLVNSIAVHAWLTINSRWLRYSPRRADGFDAAMPPYLALIFRGRDLRPPTELVESKEFKSLLATEKDLLVLATKLPLSLFLVAVCRHVEEEHAAARVRLPIGDALYLGLDHHSGHLFYTHLKSLAKEVESWMNIHADMFSRWGWSLMATRALFEGWEAAERKMAGDHSMKYHDPVEVQERSTGYMVCPPGSRGALCKYQKLGGVTYSAVQGHALAAGNGWFYTGYLPIYMASLHLRPDRPPLHTDRFYYNADPVAPPFSLLDVLRWEAYMSTNGKYADGEAAKLLSKEVLSDRLKKEARPDDIPVVRMRFSYVNAKAKSTKSTDKRPRVIPTPSLLSSSQRLPWHDPNEGSLEHLLPEYFAHCAKHFAPDEDFKLPVGAPAGAPLFQQFMSDPAKADAFVARLPANVSITGGQALCKSRQTLRELYARFLNTAARLGCMARTIGVLAHHHGVEYQELVDSARLFRAQALAAADALRTEYEWSSSSASKFSVSAMRNKFLGSECKLNLAVPVQDADDRKSQVHFSIWVARAEELLIQALLSPPNVPLDRLRIENGAISFEDLRRIGITGTVHFLDRGAMYMTELATALVERYEQWERTIGTTLYNWLTTPREVVRVQPRWRDATPVKTGAWLSSLHAYRVTIAELTPSAVLTELSATPSSTHARNFAEALVNDGEGVATTLKAFWAAATKEGCRNEIVKVAQALLAPPPAAAAVAVAAAGSGSTEQEIKLAIQFSKKVPRSMTDAFTWDLALKLFTSGAGVVPAEECHRRVVQWAAPVASGKEEKKATKGTKRKAPCGSGAGSGSGSGSSEPKAKKARLIATEEEEKEDNEGMEQAVIDAFSGS